MRFLFIALFFLPRVATAQDTLVYRVRYDLAAPSLVHVSLKLPASEAANRNADTQKAAPLTLIMPRAVPGGYAQRPYDPFVVNVSAHDVNGAGASMRREENAPRWIIGSAGERIVSIDYDVDVKRMEHEITAASDSSRIRDGYVGLLGYSILAFVEGRENEPIRLEISAPPSWPAFSTLAPKAPAAAGEMGANATDYYALADSQILMGSKLQLQEISGTAAVPLFLAAYAETAADLQQDGAIARDSLDKMIAYFGKAPFAHYTVVLELLKPISDRHQYNFSMEHLESGTFTLSADRAITANSTAAERESQRFNYAHHIAHSWIPKRAYGENYLPFRWEMVPIIETIWFNEGFGRYVAIEALAEAMPGDQAAAYRKERLDRLRTIVDSAPPFLRHMSLAELSRQGSFLYAEDFRTGMNLFSRGALMAAEMDDAIRAQTNGQKSLRNALRHLVDWTAQNHRAFRVEELPEIFRKATGVNTAAILDRHLQPLQ
jgi:predicted metalloprotease with PDZ domain